MKIPSVLLYKSLNRPGFTGGWFVQRLSDHIECVQVCIEQATTHHHRDQSGAGKHAAQKGEPNWTLKRKTLKRKKHLLTICHH